jgi:hypothetical protein
MTFQHIGSAFGREIYVSAAGEGAPSSPQGYSVAAIALSKGWKSDELGSLLNQLYGGIDDWTEFKPDGGARSFVFYGDRSEEAGNLCDAFAYAWTKGVDAEYDDVIASSNDAADLESFVETMLVGEIAVGDRYAGRLQNMLFVTQDDPARLAAIVADAVQQHRFD